ERSAGDRKEEEIVMVYDSSTGEKDVLSPRVSEQEWLNVAVTVGK
ncbi:hypothetical protein CEXT_288181, partial [Caerostris extrusa]